MFDALDAASGDRVTADTARRRAAYLCPVCRVSVFLRQGDRRRSHFAHRSGEGAETCDRFVSLWTTGLPSSGGRSSSRQVDSLQLAELCFGMIEGTAEFSIAFPAYGDADVPGSVVIDANNLYQEIPNSALERGKKVAVPFEQAPWTLLKKGGVDRDYWAAVQAAHVTLDRPTIVFHANRSNGRRVRAGETLVAGQSFWVITSQLAALMADMPHDVEVVDTIEGRQWAAVGLTLPELIDREFIVHCERWLHHAVVPTKSTAWLVSPLPSFTNSASDYIFRMSDEPTIARASRKSLLQFRDADSDAILSQAPSALEIVWQPSSPGHYFLLCDGIVCESFHITRDVGHDTCFLVAALDDGFEMPLNDVQTRLPADEKKAARPTRLKLRSLHPRVSAIVKINGDANQELIESGEITIDLTKAWLIETDALGSLVWQPSPVSPSKRLDPYAVELGRWLLGVGKMNSPGSAAKLSPELWSSLPAELADMRRTRWPVSLQAQVMNFERMLRDFYELA